LQNIALDLRDHDNQNILQHLVSPLLQVRTIEH
jgi:hypothetical protein